MSRFSVADFIPPVVPRAVKYINKLISLPNVIPHPFDQVPRNIDARVVLDIGANVGDVTLAALRAYPKCHVICFEPVKATQEILERRIESYANRVKIYTEALSTTNGEGEINITNVHGANSILAQSRMHSDLNPHVREMGKQRIKLARLDDISKQYFPNLKVDIMKIDVEGHEYDVILGGEYFIQNNVDTIIIEASLMRDLSWESQSIIEIFSLLSKLGFRWINAFDLHYSKNSNLMCVQMDCVFRHKSKLA